MPNGGADCCGNCAFNKALQEMVSPDQREQFWERSFCTLRDVNITEPFWTYCRNFERNGGYELSGDEYPDSWIFAGGLYEGYVRIPWHGNIQPQFPISCTCGVCGRTTDKGIEIHESGKHIGFCTNRHYIEWWKTKHEDNAISAEHYLSPEEFYKENDA